MPWCRVMPNLGKWSDGTASALSAVFQLGARSCMARHFGAQGHLACGHDADASGKRVLSGLDNPARSILAENIKLIEINTNISSMASISTVVTWLIVSYISFNKGYGRKKLRTRCYIFQIRSWGPPPLPAKLGSSRSIQTQSETLGACLLVQYKG